MLLFFMLAPIFLSTCIVAALALNLLVKERRVSAETLAQRALPYLLKILFLAYPLVTNVAFEAFPCHTFDDSAWLKADVSIPCGTTEHASIQNLAWLAIAVYPIGLLALNAVLIFLARQAILTQTPTPLSKAIEFLHRDYVPHMAWWELVEMIRRFTLIGLMVVLDQGSALQIVMGALVALSTSALQVQAAPYRRTVDAYLANASSFSLVVIFLICIVFKYVDLVRRDA